MLIVLMFSKDVRLPIQLQRAMAAEAEAARESRAKVMIVMSLMIMTVSQMIINNDCVTNASYCFSS